MGKKGGKRRDGYQCTVPGCTERSILHVHHIMQRSLGGGDEESNLTTLCFFHHNHGVHEGRIGLSGYAPDDPVFEIGKRGNHIPLMKFENGVRVS